MKNSSPKLSRALKIFEQVYFFAHFPHGLGGAYVMVGVQG